MNVDALARSNADLMNASGSGTCSKTSNAVTAYMFSAPRRSMEILVTRALDRHGSLPEWTRSFPLRDGTVERLNEALRGVR